MDPRGNAAGHTGAGGQARAGGPEARDRQSAHGRRRSRAARRSALRHRRGDALAHLARRGRRAARQGGDGQDARGAGALHRAGRADPAEDCRRQGDPEGQRARDGAEGLPRQSDTHPAGAAAGHHRQESAGAEQQMRTLSLLMIVAACAGAPKPAELESLEKLRTQSNLAMAQKRSPDLARDSEQLYSKSHEEWKGKELEESRRDALMASIKLKTAMALAEQDQARARTQRADADLVRSEAEYAQVAKELAAMNEQIALYRKLGNAASEKAKLTQQLGEEQQRAAARDKLAAAEMALKVADLVNAAQYAKDVYG